MEIKYQILFYHSEDSESSILEKDFETSERAEARLKELFENATKDVGKHKATIKPRFCKAEFDNSAGKWHMKYWIEPMYINESVKFWKHSYIVSLSEFDTNGLVINADSDQDALDEAIDHAEKQGWEGLFFSPEELSRMTEEEIQEYYSGGNHGRVCSSHNVTIRQID